MKISNIIKTINPNSLQSKNIDKNTITKRPGKPNTDKIEIENSISKIENKPSKYQLKLRDLKAKIDSGNYDIDSEKIAQKMIQSLRKDD